MDVELIEFKERRIFMSVQAIFILILIFALLIGIFAVSNSNPVEIKFLGLKFITSQALVILGSFASGAVITAVLGLVRQVRMGFKLREYQNRVMKLEKEMSELEKVKMSKAFEKSEASETTEIEQKG